MVGQEAETGQEVERGYKLQGSSREAPLLKGSPQPPKAAELGLAGDLSVQTQELGGQHLTSEPKQML